MLNGYIPAVVSPFSNGKLDMESFEKYINYLVNSGVSGIVVCGTTGESLALSHEEKISLLKTAADICKEKITIIAGVMMAITDDAVEFMKDVEYLVDGFLCICPFYLRPSQIQIYEHFKLLSSCTKKDIILYNIPKRTGISIEYDTFSRLCEINNIVAIKDCTSDLSLFSTWRIALGRNISFLSGNDDTACGALAIGASGVISVSANLVPELCVAMYSAFHESNMHKFAELRDKLNEVHELMFKEPSPAPLKYALSKIGLMKNELRLPLQKVTQATATKIDTMIERLNIQLK